MVSIIAEVTCPSFLSGNNSAIQYLDLCFDNVTKQYLFFLLRLILPDSTVLISQSPNPLRWYTSLGRFL